MKERINDLFWDKDLEIYCDFYGTREQALETTKGAIEQVRNTEYRWDVAEVSLQEYEDSKKKHIAMYEDMYKQFEAYPTGIMKGWLTNKNWVISTPIETHIASEDRAKRALRRIWSLFIRSRKRSHDDYRNRRTSDGRMRLRTCR